MVAPLGHCMTYNCAGGDEVEYCPAAGVVYNATGEDRLFKQLTVSEYQCDIVAKACFVCSDPNGAGEAVFAVKALIRKPVAIEALYQL